MVISRTPSDLSTTVKQLLLEAAHNKHRATLVLAGTSAWAKTCALQICNTLTAAVHYWISNQAQPEINTIAPGQIRRLLGTECDILVFDALDDFNPDALGACSGTLRGGGLLLLLTPSLQDWARGTSAAISRNNPGASSRFLQHVATTLRAAKVTVWSQEQPHDSTISRLQIPKRTLYVADAAITCTDDQQTAIHAVRQVVLGQRKKPALLISDRGRGKSAALGLAAAGLLQHGVTNILVTASYFGAVKSLFHHAHLLLPQAQRLGKSLQLAEQKIHFMTPDRIVQELPDTDLLLVDEAASIPVSVLTNWLQRYSRIAFATTVHGYEGSGRGFSARFEPQLRQLSRGIRKVQLQTPIRWAAGDPLEKLIFRLLLLDTEPATVTLPVSIDYTALKITECQRERLSTDSDLLHQLFGLLISAHYRTRPSDLRYLLDTADLSIYLARYRGQLVGTALVAEEAAEPAALARAITNGQRRPPGHLLQQALAHHLGLSTAPTLSNWRIVRIAIHPFCQRRGFGTALLQSIQTHAQASGTDLLGSSFAASKDLLPFWSRLGLSGVRLGLRRSAASGQHSAIMVQGISTAGKQLCRQARLRFLDTFEHQLAASLRSLEPGLVIALLHGSNPIEPVNKLTSYDLEMVQAFSRGTRQFAQCLASIHRAVWYVLTRPNQDIASTPILQALVRLGLQYQDLDTVVKETNQTGRFALLHGLREELQYQLGR